MTSSSIITHCGLTKLHQPRECCPQAELTGAQGLAKSNSTIHSLACSPQKLGLGNGSEIPSHIICNWRNHHIPTFTIPVGYKGRHIPKEVRNQIIGYIM